MSGRPPRKNGNGTAEAWRRHPLTGRRYRRVFGDCGNPICHETGPHWYNEVEPPKCTGDHSRTCDACRVYVPEIVDLRSVR